MTGRRKRAARGAWLVAILGVVVGSLLPAASLAMRVLNHLQISDKIQHFGAYAVLAFLPAVHERWRFIMVAGFGLMAMGYGLEVGQLYSPGRSYDLADFAADAVGVCCGVILAIPLRGAVRSLLRLQPDWSSGSGDHPKY